jgi:hypothetical protein
MVPFALWSYRPAECYHGALSSTRKIIRVTLGAGLVLLGVVGALLPIVPGWMFMIPGLLILAEFFPGVRRLVDWAKAKASGKKSPWNQGAGPGPDGR